MGQKLFSSAANRASTLPVIDVTPYFDAHPTDQPGLCVNEALIPGP